MMKVLAVIPAKPDSQRIPGKSFVEVDGLSLCQRAKHDAFMARLVTTYRTCSDHSPLLIPRPEHDEDIALVAKHCLEYMEAQHETTYDLVVTLQPTCPARTPRMIDELISEVWHGDYGGGVTVCPVKPWQWMSSGPGEYIGARGYVASQDVPKKWQETNTIQVARREAVLDGRRWGMPMCLMEMPPYAAMDIDDIHDLHYADRHLSWIIDRLKDEQFTFHRVGEANT